MTNVEFTANTINEALNEMRERGKENLTVQGQIEINESAISLCLVDLADMQERLNYGYDRSVLEEMAELNCKIRVLAEAHAYLAQFEQLAKKHD